MSQKLVRKSEYIISDRMLIGDMNALLDNQVW